MKTKITITTRKLATCFTYEGQGWWKLSRRKGKSETKDLDLKITVNMDMIVAAQYIYDFELS